MKLNVVIDEIRRVRHEISAEFGHDPKRLIQHYIELQKQHPEKLVTMAPRPLKPNEVKELFSSDPAK